jgi:uncharacterized repeat protein (TIGR01451 family)
MLLLAAWLATAGRADAGTTYIVNALAGPLGGVCDATECTLVEAISAANANPGADVIEFSVTGTIDTSPHIGAGYSLEITDPITIIGPGANLLTLKASIYVDAGGVTLSGLTIKSGGIRVESGSVATIRDCVLAENSLDYLGAIFNTGTITIIRSTLVANHSTASGGALINNFIATIVDSTVSRNSAAKAGGGIDNRGHLVISGSTFDGNYTTQAAGDVDWELLPGGGAVRNTGDLSIHNSTFTGNWTLGFGGAILHKRSYELYDADVTYSTISGNSAYAGGGIAAASRILLSSSIVALNTARDDPSSVPLDSDVYDGGTSDESFVSVGYNILGTPTGATIVATTGDQFGVTSDQLKLMPLLNNGGPTQTMALGAGSVAIDRGYTDPAVTTDQRGKPRPAAGATSDVGAFEVQDPGNEYPSVTMLTPPANAQYSDVLALRSTTTSDGRLITGTVVFELNGQTVASVPVDRSSGEASADVPLLGAAGTYQVRAVFSSSDEAILGSEDQLPVIVSAEDVFLTPHPANPVSSLAPSSGLARGSTPQFCFAVAQADDAHPGDPILLDTAHVEILALGGGTGASTFLASPVDFIGIAAPRACFFLELYDTPVGQYEVKLVVAGGYYTGSATSIFRVYQLTPTATTVDHPADTQYSDVVTLRSTTLAAGVPAPGFVEFFIDDLTVGSVPTDPSGVATLDAVVAAAAGSHVVKAIFTCTQADMLGSEDTDTLRVTPEVAVLSPMSNNPTSVVSSPGGTAIGQTQPFCYSVSEPFDGHPGGIGLVDSATVVIDEPSILAGAVTFSSGNPRSACFTLTLHNAPVGAYPITLVLTGGYYNATAMTTFSVIGASATTVDQPATTQYSDLVSLTANVAAGIAPQGTVAFYVGSAPGTLLATAPVSGGVATANIPVALVPALYPVRAVFTSTDQFVLGSEGTTTLRVMPEDLIVTPLAGNPVGMPVSSPGGTASGTTSPICFSLTEKPDSTPGNTAVIAAAGVGIAFEGSAGQTLTPGPVTVSGGGPGIPAQACFTLTLTNTPIGTYQFGPRVGVVGDGYYFGEGTASLTVSDWSADLLLSLGIDQTTIKPGDVVTYTITVRNFGPNAAANVVVNDTLSSGTTFVSASANRGSFTAPPNGQTGTVTWHPGNLSNGTQEAARITVTVIVKGKTNITNTAFVSSSTRDPNTANNAASITVTVGTKK